MKLEIARRKSSTTTTTTTTHHHSRLHSTSAVTTTAITATTAMSSPTMMMLKQTLIWGGGIIGLGVVLFKFTVPTEEELLAKMSPEMRAQVERNRELRQEEQRMLMAIVQKTAKSDEPVWKTGELFNPWEGTGNKLLIDKVNFEKEQALNKQKSELEQLREQQEKLKQAK